MEKKSKVIGMPLISIKEGSESGCVMQMIIDADAKKITHLVLGNGKGLLGINMALPFEKVVGIGRDYITTSETANLIQVYTIGEPLARYMCDCDLIGLRVLSSSGNIEGTIADFSFDEKSGALSECYLTDGNVVDTKNILSIAQKGVFIDIELPRAEKAAPPAAAPAPAASFSSSSQTLKNVFQSPGKEAASRRSDSDDYFVKKQSEYLIGRKAKKDIHSADGKPLIKSGEKVNLELIEKIRAANKLTELMLHVE